MGDKLNILYLRGNLSTSAGKSNNNEVTLHNVDFALSGTFSCEVTADAPTFSTASATKNLTVNIFNHLHYILYKAHVSTLSRSQVPQARRDSQGTNSRKLRRYEILTSRNFYIMRTI
ncbi:platelet endothelial cell adhesion molecule-like [Vespula squamosa]|uniref:Platelet endothelial cell adhesion molecule-like n=1 Tax=Vespula squamosa TaxID=30214 RepID=A0ABD1ZTX1_VESSQ